MAYDSIIIGSGLSGLTCALLLARSGRRVLVLEQHSQPAPVVRGFRRAGIYFDSGFHYVGGLGDGGAFQPLFKHLGLADRLTLTEYNPDGFDRLKINSSGEISSLPIGFAQIKEELAQRFPALKVEIEGYLNAIEQKWCCYPYLDLNVDISDFGMESVHGESLKQRLDVFSAAPELQSLLSMHSLLFGVDPGEASATLNAQVAGSYYHSVHGVDGGGKALIDAYLALLDGVGADIRCQAKVESLLEESGQVSGVRLACGEEISATEVIATQNPTLLPQIVPEGILRPAYLKRLKNLRQTMSAYVLFGKTSKPLDALERCSLFIQQQAGVFTSGAKLPLEQRSCYLTSAGEDASGQNRGIIGIVPAGYGEVVEYSEGKNSRSSGYAEKKDLVAIKIKEMLVQGCPELADLEILDLATPLTLRDYSLAPQGAIYGAGHFIGQYNPHPVTRLPGLFLSGQAIAAPGLLGTVVAAYITCGSILGHELLRGEIKTCR